MKLFRGIRSTLQRRRAEKKSKLKPSERPNASVLDFETPDALRAALSGNSVHSRNDASAHDHSVSSVSDPAFDGDNDDFHVTVPSASVANDWKLPTLDPTVSEPESMEEEFKRLRVLQSYFVLDAESEVEFDRITELARSVFDIPTALVSLVDFGRQWFLSRAGFDPNTEETPRNVAFCAHVILNRYRQLVVPDATKDPRFCNNPLVTGGPKIRFYAGAALTSPEGYNLGTLCIIGYKPRPGGLSEQQQAQLRSLAAMVMSALVARRTRLQCEEYGRNLQAVSGLFAETSRTLRRTQEDLEVSVLGEDFDDGGLWGHDIDAADRLAVVSAVKTLKHQSALFTMAARSLANTPKKQVSSALAASSVPADDVSHSSSTTYDSFLIETSSRTPTTSFKKLFQNVNEIVATLPHPTNRVIVTMEKNLPSTIVAEDLLVFRCTLNLLLHCMSKNQTVASSSSPIHLRVKARNKEELLFECQDISSTTNNKQAFVNPDSFLHPIATVMRGMFGKYGSYLGKLLIDQEHQDNNPIPTSTIYWFSIPYETLGGTRLLSRRLRQVHEPTGPKRASQIAKDPFQQLLFPSHRCVG